MNSNVNLYTVFNLLMISSRIINSIKNNMVFPRFYSTQKIISKRMKFGSFSLPKTHLEESSGRKIFQIAPQWKCA